MEEIGAHIQMQGTHAIWWVAFQGTESAICLKDQDMQQEDANDDPVNF